jgi:hypothetical protein
MILKASFKLNTLIMSTGWMTQVAPMPDKPPFRNGFTVLHTDTDTFVSSDRDAIFTCAISLCLFLPRFLSHSVSLLRPFERFKKRQRKNKFNKKLPQTRSPNHSCNK